MLLVAAAGELPVRGETRAEWARGQTGDIASCRARRLLSLAEEFLVNLLSAVC